MRTRKIVKQMRRQLELLIEDAPGLDEIEDAASLIEDGLDAMDDALDALNGGDR